MLASICGSRSQKPRKQYSRTVKRLFTGFQTNFQRLWRNMERKPLKSHATVVGGQATVGRLSINVFSTFQAIRNFVEEVAERSRDSGRRSSNCRPTVKQRFFDVSSNLKFFQKVAERSRDSGRRSRDRRLTVKQRFFGRFKQLEKNLKKSRWTVTRQWSEVTRPSADCQTTFFGRFKQLEKNLKKVAERSRDSGRRSRDRRLTVKQRFWTFQAIWENFEKSRWTVTRQWLGSRDRRPTVKQRFLDVSSDLGKFWKKSLNGPATVVEVTRPSGRLSNNVCWTLQAIRKIFEKSHWTVTRQ